MTTLFRTLLLVGTVSIRRSLGSPCIDDLNQITTNEIQLARSGAEERSRPVTYVLCPNTVFKVGYSKPSSETNYTEGSSPIVILSSHRIVQCGEYGLNADNCTIVGGENQFIIPGPQDLPLELATLPLGAVNDVTVRGLSFHDSFKLTFSITNAGTLDVVDCNFKRQRSGDFVLYTKAPTGVIEDRGLQEENELHATDLLGADFDFAIDPVVTVRISNCTWMENEPAVAVVGSIGNVQFDVEDCFFQRNVIRVQSGVGSALWFTHGRGTLQRNCFDSNIYPVSAVLVNGGFFDFVANSGVDEYRTQELGCDNGWMLVDPEITLGQALARQQFNCHTFSANSCFRNGNPPPKNSLPGAQSGSAILSTMTPALWLSALCGFLL